jgi:hypothetical protein|tara:strand:+ start:3881 stop:4063 length:183 start_codon:yes stop_codon:yes gene_type:complete
MNCFQIEVRGMTFTIWAPTIQDALETFMIDMEFYEVPKELATLGSFDTAEDIFPAECNGF